jgi:hypothetical protein
MNGISQRSVRPASEIPSTFLVTATLLIAAAGGVAFLYAYWTDAGNFFLGVALAVALVLRP